MYGLKAAEWLTIVAIFAGPVLAVQVQQWIERLRDTKQRRLRLFSTLMATRAARLSPGHVEALNMIDIEFYGWRLLGMHFRRPKQRQVIEAWRIYQDHLNQQFDAQHAESWAADGNERFVDMLHKISIALGYDFDRLSLKRGVYYPKGHDDNDIAQRIIRDQLVRVLSGQQPLQMAVTSVPANQDATDHWQKMQDAIIGAASGSQPIKVQIKEPDSGGGLRGPRVLRS